MHRIRSSLAGTGVPAAPNLAAQDDGEGGNPQSAATTMTVRRAVDKELSSGKIRQVVLECMSEPVRRLLLKDPPLRIALVIDHCGLSDHVVSAIRNPVSTCRVDSLTVLRHVVDEDDADGSTAETRFLRDAQAWLARCHMGLESTEILQGHKGFEEILRRDSVDAVYIYVPSEMQQTYVLGALQARKHVLLKDPVSTPCDDFVEQMRYAVKGTSS